MSVATNAQQKTHHRDTENTRVCTEKTAFMGLCKVYGSETFHLSLNVPPVNVPPKVSVRLAPDGLFEPGKIITFVAHWPGARLPRFRGNGAPLLVGEESVPVVNLTLFAVVPPVFCTVTATAMSPQFVRTSAVVVSTSFAGSGVGVGVGDGDGLGDGEGDGDGDGEGLGVGVGVGVGDGPPGCNSKAPTSVPSPLFAIPVSSKVRAKTWR